MDHIDDKALWTPTDYDLADSLANWGPAIRHDCVYNYEAEGVADVSILFRLGAPDCRPRNWVRLPQYAYCVMRNFR